MFKAIVRSGFALLLLTCSFVHPASAQIAPGVLQSAAHTAVITGTVTKNDGTPVGGANVHLQGPAVLDTTADSHGTFSFSSVPYGVYTVVVTSSNGTTSSPLTVNGDITIVIAYNAQGAGALKEIARVSAHTSGASINVTPASIASVTPADYAFQGNATWTQMLNRIPGVQVNGDLEGGQQISDFLVGSLITPQVLSINGALPYETSVTLDGMPLESNTDVAKPGTGFDLSGLPLSIFDTADVVRGPGANAPSIVDSIGGSFVLHAPAQVDKNEVEFSISNDPWGGVVSNMKVAHRFGKLSAIVTYGVNASPGAFGNSTQFQAAATAPITVNGNVVSTTAPCGPVACDNISAAPCSSIDKGGISYQPLNFCDYGDEFLTYGFPNSTKWSQHTGAMSLMYNFTPNITGQVFYSAISGEVNDPFGLHLVDFVPGPGYAGPIPAGFNYEMYNNDYHLYEGSHSLEEKLTDYMGKGVLRLAAVQYTSWNFADHICNSTYPTGTYTLYGDLYYAANPTVPVVFNGQQATLTWESPYFLDEQFWTNNRDLLGSYATTLGSNIHAGVSFTQTYYNFNEYVPEDVGSSGLLIAANDQSANSSTLDEYRINAGEDFTDKFSADASWYFANANIHTQNPPTSTAQSAPWNTSTYSYAAPRLGLTWRADPNNSIRLAVGGGYSLPPLAYVLGSTPVPSCTGGGPICSVTTTNFNLKPEKSFGWDIGTDMRFHGDTTASLDFYLTNLYGQFFTTSAPSSYSGSMCTSPPCTLFSTEYNNLQQTRYEGVNLSIDHEPARGFYGQVSVGLMRAYLVSLPAGFYNSGSATCVPATGAGCTNIYILTGENFNGASQSGLPPEPYANGSATIGYRWSPRGFIDIAPTYYGNGNGYFIPAFLEFNAHISFPATKNVTLLLTMENLTNIDGASYETEAIPGIAVNDIIPSQPYGEYTIPYGPRAAILTVNFKE